MSQTNGEPPQSPSLALSDRHRAMLLEAVMDFLRHREFTRARPVLRLLASEDGPDAHVLFLYAYCLGRTGEPGQAHQVFSLANQRFGQLEDGPERRALLALQAAMPALFAPPH